MKRAVIRLPVDLVDRLDLLTRELRLAHPEQSYSRASVARALLASALVYARGLRPDEPGSAPEPPRPQVCTCPASLDEE